MEISIWAWATLALKLIIYASFAALVAGPLFIKLLDNRQMKHWLFAYTMVATLLGITCVLLFFFVQVGAISEAGWQGMWDPLMMQFIWQSSAGDSALYRLGVLATFGVLALGYVKNGGFGDKKPLVFCVYLGCLFTLGYSFTITGHIAQLEPWARVLLALHLLIVAGWIGSLWPLARLCQHAEADVILAVMKKFGQIAIILVPLLLAAGILLALNLLDSWQALFNTDYGLSLLLKLSLVAVILLIAAVHKFKFVRAIKQGHHRVIRLQRSIYFELVVGLLILLTTAGLTSLVGPGH